MNVGRDGTCPIRSVRLRISAAARTEMVVSSADATPRCVFVVTPKERSRSPRRESRHPGVAIVDRTAPGRVRLRDPGHDDASRVAGHRVIADALAECYGMAKDEVMRRWSRDDLRRTPPIPPPQRVRGRGCAVAGTRVDRRDTVFGRPPDYHRTRGRGEPATRDRRARGDTAETRIRTSRRPGPEAPRSHRPGMRTQRALQETVATSTGHERSARRAWPPPRTSRRAANRGHRQLHPLNNTVGFLVEGNERTASRTPTSSASREGRSPSTRGRPHPWLAREDVPRSRGQEEHIARVPAKEPEPDEVIDRIVEGI